MKKEVKRGYTFRCVSYDGEVTTMHIPYNDVTLNDLCEKFQYFLKGCSFSFDGNIEIVDDNDDIEPLENPHTGDAFDLEWTEEEDVKPKKGRKS
jgi:hypothetical protein